MTPFRFYVAFRSFIVVLSFFFVVKSFIRHIGNGSVAHHLHYVLIQFFCIQALKKTTTNYINSVKINVLLLFCSVIFLSDILIHNLCFYRH